MGSGNTASKRFWNIGYVLLRVKVTDSQGGYNKFGYYLVGITGNKGSFKAMVNPVDIKLMDSNVEILLKEADVKNIMSSNPYDYIDGDAFTDIVEMGPTALMSIRQMIRNNKENGLKEYILAIAAEKIAGVDFKRDSSGWSNAKEWCWKWDSHMRRLPASIAMIVSSDLSIIDKNNALVKIGLPAVPFIVEEIEKGNTGFDIALDILSKNSSALINWTAGEDMKSFVKTNGETISFLKEMAEAYRK